MKKDIPCKLSTYSKEDKGNLMKVKLYVMSDGKNYNGSSISIDTFIKSCSSISSHAPLV